MYWVKPGIPLKFRAHERFYRKVSKHNSKHFRQGTIFEVTYHVGLKLGYVYAETPGQAGQT